MHLQQIIAANQRDWDRYQYHDFVRYLANSKLKKEAFNHYLIQDYLFLKSLSKVYALAIYKSQDHEELAFFSFSMQTLLQEELGHHITYCAEQGIDETALQQAEEELMTIAYSRYLLDIANSYGVNEILIALAPCVIGYRDIAAKIGTEIRYRPKVAAYCNWVAMYQGEVYKQSADEYETFINKKIAAVPMDSVEAARYLAIFKTALRCENAFWSQSFIKYQHARRWQRVWG